MSKGSSQSINYGSKDSPKSGNSDNREPLQSIATEHTDLLPSINTDHKKELLLTQKSEAGKQTGNTFTKGLETICEGKQKKEGEEFAEETQRNSEEICLQTDFKIKTTFFHKVHKLLMSELGKI